MITENLSTLKIHKLTQSQYERELAAGNIDEGALYLTPDITVDSINGKTGDVTLTASDVGARKDTWLPTISDIGAAATEHNHSANEITSGTLEVARGGTGATTAAEAREKLGITLANLGAAPSGYGLGTTVQTAPNDDPNQITKTGFYSTQHANLASGSSGRSYILHLTQSDTYAMQLQFDLNEDVVAIRKKVEGTWGEWEDFKSGLVSIGTSLDDTALSTALATVYDAMPNVSQKMVTYTDASGWRYFGILTRSSANNGSMTAHSAYNKGTSIIKSKTSGSWQTAKTIMSNGFVPIASGGLGRDFTSMPKGAVLRNSTDNSGFWYTETANGAMYATSSEGVPKFGTLPIAQGGTGRTTLTVGYYLAGNGTSSVTMKSPATVLSDIGAISIVKLWENASPTSSFAAQTVSLDLSEYDGVIVSGTFQTSALAICSSGFVPKNVQGVLVATYTSDDAFRARRFTATNTGVTFTIGTQLSTGNDSTGAAIPVYIYGVKGVS